MSLKQKVMTYENVMVLVFFFVTGFLYLDMLMPSYLLPVITKDLHLNNTQVGQLGMLQTIGFSVSTLIFGFLSDKLKMRKIIIIISMLGIALSSFLLLFIDSFAGLVIIRIFAGACEGAALPVIFAVIQVDSGPGHFGRNVGLAEAGAGIIASIIGPVAMTQVYSVMDWRLCGLLVSIPSLITVLLVIKLIRETRTADAETAEAVPGTGTPQVSFMGLLKYKNILVSIVLGFLFLSGMWTIVQFTPLYLTEMGKMPVHMMGFIMSAFGIMTIFWSVFIPASSDYLGRKPVLITCFFLAALVPVAMCIFPEGMIGTATFILLGGNCVILTTLLMGVIPLESVPLYLTASASALISGVGQFFGSFSLGLVGKVSDIYGLKAVMVAAAIVFIAAGIIGFALKETNPRKLGEEN